MGLPTGPMASGSPIAGSIRIGKRPRGFHLWLRPAKISVAHGLRYAADNLGQIERESEVADIRRTRELREDRSERYIEK